MHSTRNRFRVCLPTSEVSKGSGTGGGHPNLVDADMTTHPQQFETRPGGDSITSLATFDTLFKIRYECQHIRYGQGVVT